MTTYKLQADFYEQLSSFADRVLSKGEDIRPMIRNYLSRIPGDGAIKTELEYLLEFLSLGVYWREYGGRAAKGMPCQGLLTALARRRNKGGLNKVLSDWVRGIALTAFAGNRTGKELEKNANGLAKLISWLQASGEYSLEAAQFLGWLDWLEHLSAQGAQEVVQAALDFAAWYEGEAQLALGQYTAGVEPFLKETLPGHRWQENYILCGRRPVEYHLNMLGSELLNWAYRKDFFEAEKHVVLVPRCMCKAGRRCRAAASPYGYKCAYCTPGCQVAVLTQLGCDRGFRVYVIPHESNAFARWRDNNARREGVVGIACATRLIDGGLKAKALGIPAQCVLLDSCGCRHWREEEAVTSINMERLLEILDQDSGSEAM